MYIKKWPHIRQLSTKMLNSGHKHLANFLKNGINCSWDKSIWSILQKLSRHYPNCSDEGLWSWSSRSRTHLVLTSNYMARTALMIQIPKYSRAPPKIIWRQSYPYLFILWGFKIIFRIIQSMWWTIHPNGPCWFGKQGREQERTGEERREKGGRKRRRAGRGRDLKRKEGRKWLTTIFSHFCVPVYKDYTTDQHLALVFLTRNVI